MFGVTANSNVASPPAVSPGSPSAEIVDKSTDANGEPVFADEVRDALNRTTNDGTAQSSSSVKTPDTPPAQQSNLQSSAKDSLLAKLQVFLKRPSKPQQQASSDGLQPAPDILAAFLTSVSQSLLPQSPATNAPSTPHGPPDNAPMLAGAVTQSGSSDSTKQVTVGENPSATIEGQVQSQFQSQLDTQIESNLTAVPPDSSTAQAPDLVSGNANRTANTPGICSLPPSNGETTGETLAATGRAALSVAADAANVAMAFASPSPVTNQTDSPLASAPSPAQRTGVTAEISTSSPSPAQGQFLSSLLQQVTYLHDPSAWRFSSPSVAVNLARTEVQNQFTQTAATPPFVSSLAVHASGLVSALASARTKSEPSGIADPVQIVQAQAPTPAVSSHSAAQDSSSNHDGQNSTDPSASSDSSQATVPSAKSTSSAFAEVLTAVSVPKPESAPATQAVAAAIPALSQNDLPARPMAETTTQAAAPTPPPSESTPQQADTRFVNDAQLTTAANQSEMRIAMQTAKLGAVELHARVSGDQVGAAILVEKRDAHAALAAELPALQQALTDKQLRVGQVALSQGSLSSTAGDAGAHAQGGQRGMSQPQRSNSFWTESRMLTAAAWFIPEQIGVFNAQGRLSVQA